jgi:hypothetical protein
MQDVDIANLALSYVAGKPITAIDTTTSQGRAILKWFGPTRDEVLAAHPWGFASKRARLTTNWLSFSGTPFSNNGSGLIRVTYASHGLSTGQRVTIENVVGVANANGTWYVTVIDSNNFDLQDSQFSGTWQSGTGQWVLVPLFEWDYMFTLPSDLIRVNEINGLGANEEDSMPYIIEQGVLMCDEDTLQLTYVFQHTTYTAWPQFFINAFAFLLASNVAQELTGPASKSLDLRKQYEQAIAPQAQKRDSRQGKGKRVLPLYDSQLVRSRAGFYSESY